MISFLAPALLMFPLLGHASTIADRGREPQYAEGNGGREPQYAEGNGGREPSTA